MLRRNFLGYLGLSAGAAAVPAVLLPTAQSQAVPCIPMAKTAPVKGDKIKDAILEYVGVMKRYGIGVTPGIVIPFFTKPCGRHINTRGFEKLPEPSIPANDMLEIAGREHPANMALGWSVRAAMVELLPGWCKVEPTPVGAAVMCRIISSKYMWDVDDNYDLRNQRAMVTLASMALAPIAELVNLKRAHGFTRVTIDPLSIYVKREAYMMDAFSYAHVLDSDVNLQGTVYGLDWKQEQKLMSAESARLDALKAKKVV